MVETSYNAQPSDTESKTANIDRLLREQGFLLYTLSVLRYSRAALPAPFLHPTPMQTTFGQAMFGDTVYLRDAGSSDYAEVWGDSSTRRTASSSPASISSFRLPTAQPSCYSDTSKRSPSSSTCERRSTFYTAPARPASLLMRGREYMAAFDRDPSALSPTGSSSLRAALGACCGSDVYAFDSRAPPLALCAGSPICS